MNDMAVKDVLKCCMEKLMNEENQWDNEVTNDRKERPSVRIDRSEIEQALKRMKKHKASGISGIVTGMTIAGKELSVDWLCDFCKKIVQDGDD